TPSNGQTFQSAANIPIAAQADDSEGFVRTVEFFVNGASIGITTNNPLSASPINPFQVTFAKVPPGQYTLTATATDNLSATAESVPVTITVKPSEQNTIIVTARASGTISFFLPELSLMEAHVGNTIQSTYSRGTSHQEFRRGFIEFAIPQISGHLVAAKLQLVETRGMMTQPVPPERHQLSFYAADLVVGTNDYNQATTAAAYFETDHNLPPRTFSFEVTPVVKEFAGGNLGFRINLAEDPDITGMVSLGTEFQGAGDRPGPRLLLTTTQSPTSSLWITRPVEGETFKPPASITIQATAIDPRLYIRRVEFFEHSQKIGVSEIAFVKAPDPGTPILHTFEWKNVPSGDYTLSAHAIDSLGATITSVPIHVKVEAKPTPANFPPKVDITSPKNENVFAAPAAIQIQADVADADGTVREVAFYAGDKLLGRDTRGPFSLTWTDVPEGHYILTAVATDDKDAKTTSIPVAITVKTRTVQPGTLIAAGSVWKYLDDGTDQGTAWRTPTFDDGKWAAGPGQLGYGDGDEATVVRFGADPQHKQITTYFRQSFKVVNSSSYSNLVVRLVRDDGAVVYLNGIEVFRSNLPAGPISFSTLATSAVGGADESTHFYSTTADPKLLLDGLNVLAIEVHQASVSSSDLSFDLDLIANAQSPVGNANAILTIHAPKDGESFLTPARITINATAIDPKGYISHVEFFEGDRRIGVSQIDFIRAPDPGTPIEHEFVWTNVPPGNYKLTARAKDTTGETIVSKPVQIVVRSPQDVTFVNRELPELYLPGQKLKVQLDAKPRSTTQIYAVEDTVPSGWVAGVISNDGVFDPVKRKVKFGPFFDNKARLLTYEVTPPDNASGTKEFSGIGSADGVNNAIGGDKTIPSALRHPADNKPADNAITIVELTAYASAWRSGTTWPILPNPIPISYVTRAGALWKGGEQYVFDPSAGPAPAWWVNKPPSRVRTAITDSPLPSSPDSRIGTVVRTPTSTLVPDAPITVTLTVVPSTSVKSYAVEDQPPRGWAVSDISDSGVFDPMTRKVKWGLFLDDRRRTLTYHVVPPGRISAQTAFVGLASFDGMDITIGGEQQPIILSADPAAVLTSIDRSPTGTCRLNFRGEPGRQYRIQASDDLERWVELDRVGSGGGSFQFIDPGAIDFTRRF
ncbi:MAG: Ig-like domain-containing protein, partial [Verrucomicrobiota bacterium]